ncbi:hypothetical protein [Nautilia sp.]
MTIISIPFFLFADYYLSYKAVVKNYLLLFSQLECSKTLTLKNSPKKLLFVLETGSESGKVTEICKRYKNEIINRLLRYQAVVNAFYSKEDRVKIVFLPHRFDIIIKNQKTYFYIKGDE